MTNTPRLRLLIVDDETGDGLALAAELDEGQIRAEVSHPSEIVEEDLVSADLILVDYDLGSWPTSEEVGLARRPTDGLALAAVLRSTRRALKPVPRQAAIALYSSQLNKLSGGLSDDVREHAIARLNNLEWVFDKHGLEDQPPLAERVTGLAGAVRLLPQDWPTGDAARTALFQEILGWKKEMLGAEEAWQSVWACRPPLHELSAASRGLALLRWLAHRILPYPCFLSDERWLAFRIGVERDSLHAVLANSDNPLTKRLAEVRFDGALGCLLGPRWWRAGLETLLWEWQGYRSDRDVLHRTVEEVAGQSMTRLAVQRPVQVLNAAYLTLERPVNVESAVRITPDDWPPYADQAWMELSRVKRSSRLKALVVPDDVSRLD